MDLTRASIVSAVMIVQAVVFADVARGTSSQIDQPRTVVVRSAEEWQALWATHTSVRAPKVDFSKSIVVGVFLGTRPTEGFAVQIIGVRQTGAGAVVEYIERTPDPGRMVAQVLTSPFHLVTVPRAIQAVEFKKVKGAQVHQFPSF